MKKILTKTVAVCLTAVFSFCAVFPTPAFAQSVAGLPEVGAMVALSPAFTPTLIRGLRVDPQDPFKFDFIVDAGDAKLEGAAFNQETEKLIKYFLASLTIPEQDLWVNLSPYEAERIIPDNFGQTEMGRDLLALDYLLKQITASLIYPEDELGKKFWQTVYRKAFEQYGTTQVPVDTFNKVWIVPEKAVIYENSAKAFIVESHLKVMLEEDYLAIQVNSEKSLVNSKNQKSKTIHNSPDTIHSSSDTISSQIIRDVVIPELEKEVNAGKNFAPLRQIYHSLILATWFKTTLKNSILNRKYSDQGKTSGVAVDDPAINRKIYDQYLAAFEKGVCNMIRVEFDPNEKRNLPRKYFSGGFNWDRISSTIQKVEKVSANALPPSTNFKLVENRFGFKGVAASNITAKEFAGNLSGQKIYDFEDRELELWSINENKDSVNVYLRTPDGAQKSKMPVANFEVSDKGISSFSFVEKEEEIVIAPIKNILETAEDLAKKAERERTLDFLSGLAGDEATKKFSQGLSILSNRVDLNHMVTGEDFLRTTFAHQILLAVVAQLGPDRVFEGIMPNFERTFSDRIVTVDDGLALKKADGGLEYIVDNAQKNDPVPGLGAQDSVITVSEFLLRDRMNMHKNDFRLFPDFDLTFENRSMAPGKRYSGVDALKRYLAWRRGSIYSEDIRLQDCTLGFTARTAKNSGRIQEKVAQHQQASLDGPVTRFEDWIGRISDSVSTVLSEEEMKAVARELQIPSQDVASLLQNAKYGAEAAYKFAHMIKKESGDDGKINVYLLRDAASLYMAGRDILKGENRCFYISSDTFRKAPVVSGGEEASRFGQPIYSVIYEAMDRLGLPRGQPISSERFEEFENEFYQILRQIMRSEQLERNVTKSLTQERQGELKAAANYFWDYFKTLDIPLAQIAQNGIRFVDTTMTGSYVLFMKAILRLKLEEELPKDVDAQQKIDGVMFYSQLSQAMSALPVKTNDTRIIRAPEYSSTGFSYPVKFSGEFSDSNVPIMSEQSKAKNAYLFYLIALKSEILKWEQNQEFKDDKGAQTASPIVEKLTPENYSSVAYSVGSIPSNIKEYYKEHFADDEIEGYYGVKAVLDKATGKVYFHDRTSHMTVAREKLGPRTDEQFGYQLQLVKLKKGGVRVANIDLNSHLMHKQKTTALDTEEANQLLQGAITLPQDSSDVFVHPMFNDRLPQEQRGSFPIMDLSGAFGTDYFKNEKNQIAFVETIKKTLVDDPTSGQKTVREESSKEMRKIIYEFVMEHIRLALNGEEEAVRMFRRAFRGDATVVFRDPWIEKVAKYFNILLDDLKIFLDPATDQARTIWAVERSSDGLLTVAPKVDLDLESDQISRIRHFFQGQLSVIGYFELMQNQPDSKESLAERLGKSFREVSGPKIKITGNGFEDASFWYDGTYYRFDKRAEILFRLETDPAGITKVPPDEAKEILLDVRISSPLKAKASDAEGGPLPTIEESQDHEIGFSKPQTIKFGGRDIEAYLRPEDIEEIGKTLQGFSELGVGSVDESALSILAYRYVLTSRGYDLKPITPIQEKWVSLDISLPEFDMTFKDNNKLKLVDRIEAFVKANPGRKIRVLDWGCGRLWGKGSLLVDILAELRKRGLADRVELIGFANAIFPEWAHVDPSIRLFWGDANQLFGFLDHNPVDIIVSVNGLDYVGQGNPVDKGKQDFINYLSNLATVLNQGGQVLLTIDRFMVKSSDFFSGKEKYPDEWDVFDHFFSVEFPRSLASQTAILTKKPLVLSGAGQAAGSDLSPAPGGIDLNPKNLDLEVKSKSGAIQFEIDKDFENIEINGLTPVILNVTPITNLPLLLGATESEAGLELSKL